MKVYFCKSRSLFGRIVQRVLLGSYGHVAIGYNGVVYDADPIHGVRRQPLMSFLQRYKTVDQIEVEVEDRDTVLDWLKAQEGKPYDFTAILGFLFDRNWQKENKWFCSELVAKALIIGRKIKGFPPNKVTPRDLYYLLYRRKNAG